MKPTWTLPPPLFPILPVLNAFDSPVWTPEETESRYTRSYART
jgi:hypothetical protein